MGGTGWQKVAAQDALPRRGSETVATDKPQDALGRPPASSHREGQERMQPNGSGRGPELILLIRDQNVLTAEPSSRMGGGGQECVV